ncbi:MAG: dTDP-4-dehydrorhamnose reductase [Acidobacteriota bacterium]|nr:dTDP-4-dehydrorhamnose reductase [Acidobacteriota bacterium]
MLVTGAGGMVGRAVCDVCASCGDLVLPYDHQKLDIGDPELVTQLLEDEKPEAVINCAAWTDVDGCELDEKRAFEVNALGPENLARASREIDAVLVTISTDYVFDGKKNGFYTQRDQPRPESIYGKSKLEGEHLAQLAYARTIVVRTGFVFGTGGKNFLSTIVERARRGEKLKAISDAYGTPTYALDLSVRLRELCILDLPGLYHVVNSGEGASFEEFVREALEIADCDEVDVEVVSMDSLKRPALRPRNSRLRCLVSEAIGLQTLPDWRTSLYDFVKQHHQSNTGEEVIR